jgi:hypothetical protein
VVVPRVHVCIAIRSAALAGTRTVVSGVTTAGLVSGHGHARWRRRRERLHSVSTVPYQPGVRCCSLLRHTVGFQEQRRPLWATLCDANRSLGDAESSLGDAKSSLSSVGRAAERGVMAESATVQNAFMLLTAVRATDRLRQLTKPQLIQVCERCPPVAVARLRLGLTSRPRGSYGARVPGVQHARSLAALHPSLLERSLTSCRPTSVTSGGAGWAGDRRPARDAGEDRGRAMHALRRCGGETGTASGGAKEDRAGEVACHGTLQRTRSWACVERSFRPVAVELA